MEAHHKPGPIPFPDFKRPVTSPTAAPAGSKDTWRVEPWGFLDETTNLEMDLGNYEKTKHHWKPTEVDWFFQCWIWSDLPFNDVPCWKWHLDEFQEVWQEFHQPKQKVILSGNAAGSSRLSTSADLLSRNPSKATSYPAEKCMCSGCGSIIYQHIFSWSKRGNSLAIRYFLTVLRHLRLLFPHPKSTSHTKQRGPFLAKVPVTQKQTAWTWKMVGR